ncbi:MAG: hypothetical protein U0L91_07595 [Gemmiger sp.]|uniref:hypothetical protein n=1 Tax=Gemmiger sp. TaxID=2049027 RepID=UPI002E799FFF|nr:hypothetical protein [Gemmiger sp.]MEE0801127.1 hypothetical protein [Gemmiger sp.]
MWCELQKRADFAAGNTICATSDKMSLPLQNLHVLQHELVKIRAFCSGQYRTKTGKILCEKRYFYKKYPASA